MIWDNIRIEVEIMEKKTMLKTKIKALLKVFMKKDIPFLVLYGNGTEGEITHYQADFNFDDERHKNYQGLKIILAMYKLIQINKPEKIERVFQVIINEILGEIT